MESPTYGADFAHQDYYFWANEATLGPSQILHE
jgi:hypothetical protein